jgi:CheY-like chemotaxis protein
MEKSARTVLVIEGDDHARALIVFILERDGYRVHAATTVSSAPKELENHPEIELILADVRMSGVDDLVEFAECARKLRPGLRMLYTTGLAGTMRTVTRNELMPGCGGRAAGVLAMLETLMKMT